MIAVIILCSLNLIVSAGIFYYVFKPRTIIVEPPKEDEKKRIPLDEQLSNLLSYDGGKK